MLGIILCGLIFGVGIRGIGGSRCVSGFGGRGGIGFRAGWILGMSAISGIIRVGIVGIIVRMIVGLVFSIVVPLPDTSACTKPIFPQ